MYTQCPECKSTRQITTEELRDTRGMVSCANCSALFDVLELLSDDIPKDKSIDFDYPDNAEPEKNSILPPVFWSIGSSICILAFIFQIYFFEGYNLTQNASSRAWLEKASSVFDKQLPVYKNLNEFSILHGSFEPQKDNAFIFKTTLTNQSAYTQNYPSIKLTLIDFTGLEFASRIFLADDYAANNNEQIKPETTLEISLTIAAPVRNIGGYHFELI